MIQGNHVISASSGSEYAGPNLMLSTAEAKTQRSPRTSMAQLEFSTLQEFFKNCEVGDICAEEDVVVDGRSHYHCLLCQAIVRSASKLQDHCMRHANSKSVPPEHELCIKYFTRFTPTCSQNCQLSQNATKHRHCRLCGGAHTDPDSRGLGYHVERWHTRHYTEVKEIVDLARKLNSYLQPEQSQATQENEQRLGVVMQVPDCQAADMGQSGDVSASMEQSVYAQRAMHPGSWQTSTTQMTDGSLATVHQWTGSAPPVYPPNCTVQSMEQPQQPGDGYILQERQVEPTGSQFVIQEAAAQSGVDEGYTLQVDSSNLNPSQEAASIILQMMDRVQMPDHQPGLAAANRQPQELPLIQNMTTPDHATRRPLSPGSRKRVRQVSSAGNVSPVPKQAKPPGNAEDHVEVSDSETLPLVFKSKPLPGTVIDPISTPKVWQQCLVCGSSSYLRTIRIASEGNRRNMNKAQTARLMSYFKIAVDPTLPGKLICKQDFETWLKFDKKLQQLLHGEDDKSHKGTDGVTLKTKTYRRKPLTVDKKTAPVELSPPSHTNVKQGRPRKSSEPMRIPRSRRLRERMEREVVQSSDDEENVAEDSQEFGKDKQNSDKAEQVTAEHVVFVEVSENDPATMAETDLVEYKVIVGDLTDDEGQVVTQTDARGLTGGQCNQTAGECNQTAGACNQTAGKCNQTAGECNQTGGECNQTAGECNQTAWKCNQTGGECNQRAVLAAASENNPV